MHGTTSTQSWGKRHRWLIEPEYGRKCVWKRLHNQLTSKGTHRDLCWEPPNYRISTIMAQHIKPRPSLSVWNVSVHIIKMSQEPSKYLCDMQCSDSGVISSSTLMKFEVFSGSFGHITHPKPADFNHTSKVSEFNYRTQCVHQVLSGWNLPCRCW